MPRFVVLRHERAGSPWHYDWMVERENAPALLTFRTRALPTESDDFEAERIGDHRILYLSFEGELSGGRGRVTRIAEGDARIEAETERMIRIRLEDRLLLGTPGDGGGWRFTRDRSGELASDPQTR